MRQVRLNQRELRPNPVLDYTAASSARRSWRAYVGQAVLGMVAGAVYTFLGGITLFVWQYKSGTRGLHQATMAFVALVAALVTATAWISRGRRWGGLVFGFGLSVAAVGSLLLYLLYQS